MSRQIVPYDYHGMNYYFDSDTGRMRTSKAVSFNGTYEVRTVNEKTGGEKGSKPEQYNLIPWEQMNEVARVYASGAAKYSPTQWRKGYDWSLSYDALVRHLVAFWEGESKDEETQCNHLASVVFHALALMNFEKHHPELDNRPNTKSD